MDRRIALILPAFLALGAADSSAQQAHKKPNEIYLFAPDDVLIDEIFVPGGKVAKGQKLLVLSSNQLAKFQSRLDSIRKLVAVYERPFHDGRMDHLLATLKVEAAAANFDYKAKVTILAEVQKRHDNGAGATLGDVASARAALEVADAKRLTADFQVKHEPLRIKDVLDKLEVAKAQLEIEAEMLTKHEKSLTIIAPSPGRFWIEVGDKSFVEKGARIGGIEL